MQRNSTSSADPSTSPYYTSEKPPENNLEALIARIDRVAQVRPPEIVTNLTEWRQEQRTGRLAALGNPFYCFLDTSPTGTGKSYADGAVVAHLETMGKRTLTLVPTHEDCRAVVQQYRVAHGVEAVAYPLFCEKTCERFDEAQAVFGLGLSPVAALCPTCPLRNTCAFQEQYQAAKYASHAVATQARGSVALEKLALGKSYIAIHENPLQLLRPSVLTHEGLKVVAWIAREAHYQVANPQERHCYLALEAIAQSLHGWHHSTNETTEIPLPRPLSYIPLDLERRLLEAVRSLGLPAWPPAEAMKLVLAVARGELCHLAVRVDTIRETGGAIKLLRTLVGTGQRDLPEGTVVFSDATADPTVLQTLVGKTLHSITPQGRLPWKHPVLQVIPPRDITRSSGPARGADLLRGILHDLPQYEHVGLITHRPLVKKVLVKLGEDAAPITRSSYFGSALTRNSNTWMEECDLLVVLGTPRVPPSAIRDYLFRTGRGKSASLKPEQTGWHLTRWTGTTQSGLAREVLTPAYTHPDWQAAYRALVYADLLQVIGRGRSLLTEGIPVLVATTEPLGDPYPLADAPFAPLTVALAQVIQALRHGRATTRAIAGWLATSPRYACQLLHRLELDGRVERVGVKRGWRETPALSLTSLSPIELTAIPLFSETDAR